MLKRSLVPMLVIATLWNAACGDDDTSRDDTTTPADVTTPSDAADSSGAADLLGDGSVDTDLEDLSSEIGASEVADTSGDSSDTTSPWHPMEEPLVMGDEGAVYLVVAPSPFSVTIMDGGAERASTSEPAFAFGVPDAFDPEAFYDPYDEYHPLDWVGSTDVMEYQDDGTTITLRVAMDDTDTERVGLVTIAEEAPGRFVMTVEPETWQGEANLRWSFVAPGDEEYYGLGEWFGGMLHRGTVKAMQFELTGGESGYNEAHVPIPWLVSTGAWALFAEERRPGAFDVAASDPETIDVTFETKALTVHLLAAESPMATLTHYVAMTGAPAVPPPWAFGGHLWRNANVDGAEVLADAQAMRDNDIPDSVIWIDNPWQNYYNDCVFDDDMFDDPSGLVEDLRALGYRVVVWSTPYIEEDMGAPYTTALEEGYFVQSDTQFLKFGRLLDLTNPSAVSFYQGMMMEPDACVPLGVEGFKLDYAEDIQLGLMGIALSYDFFNGEDERTMHHHYSYFYQKTYADMFEPEEAFIMGRTGTFGAQTVCNSIWPGDLDSDFHFYGDDDYWVGGLPAAINGGLGLSVAGYPFFASDTGGFRNNRPTKEVLLRWAWYSALGTIMQTGGGGKNHNPWDFAQYESDGVVSQYDQETVDIFREAARLHVMLFPYRYTYARLAHDTGRCVTCPVGFVYPDEGVHPEYEFLLGDWLLAAPIHAGGTTKEVYLPPGTWIDWFSGSVHQGPATETLELALDEVGLFVKAGALIPLLRPTIDTLAPATVEGVESYADDPGVLYVRAYPATEPSSFELWEGTTLSQSTTDDGVTISMVDGGTFQGARVSAHWAAIPSVTVPGTITIDGQPLTEAASMADLDTCASCWYWDDTTTTLELTLPPGDWTIATTP